jgi:hypothetical protein
MANRLNSYLSLAITAKILAGLFACDDDDERLESRHELVQQTVKSKSIVMLDKLLASLVMNENLTDRKLTAEAFSKELEDVREKLNQVSDELFTLVQKAANQDFFYGEYGLMVLGAMTMCARVIILDGNRQLSKDVTNRFYSSPSFASPLNDMAFRDPSKVQLLAALDFYENDKPREIFEVLRWVPFLIPKTSSTTCMLTSNAIHSCLSYGRPNPDITPTTLNCCAKCKAA